MYQKKNCLILPLSTSALNNNLVVYNTKSRTKMDTVAVIHNDQVNIIALAENEHKNFNRTLCCATYFQNKEIIITQVEWGTVGYITVFLVTSTVGLLVFDKDANVCLYRHPCSDPTTNREQGFAKGIAIVNSYYFCIGNSAGCIRMFGAPIVDSCEIGFVDRKLRHNKPILDLTSYKNFLASIDEGGTLIMWRVEAEEMVLVTMINSNSSCTGIILRKEWFLMSCISGQMKLYDFEKLKSSNKESTPVIISQDVEVMAHARSITGMDVSRINDLILTVSEDSYAKIWKVNRERNLWVITHESNVHVKDNMLMGAKFLTNGGTEFCVSTYDSNIITCYSL